MNNLNHQPPFLTAAEIMTRYGLATEEYQRELLSKGQYLDYLYSLPEGGALFKAFRRLYPYITDDAEYWRCLSAAFSGKEIYISYLKQWWLRRFEVKRAHREAFMEKEETVAFAALPDDLVIYRGYQKHCTRKGLSWSLSKDVAIWFARRWPEQGAPMVVSGKCKKSDVVGYTDELKEQEIIINPTQIKGIKNLIKF